MKLRILKIFFVFGLMVFLTACGGGGGGGTSTTISDSGGGGDDPVPIPLPDPQTLTELYGSQVVSSNINISSMNLSGFTTAMVTYPEGSSTVLNAIRSSAKYAFIRYEDITPKIKKHSGNTIASILPKYTKQYEHYADAAKLTDSYGLPDDDYLVLVTLSGGQFDDGTSLAGEIYTIVPLSYLQAGVQPKFSALGSYVVMQILEENFSNKNDVLSKLELYANNYFFVDPITGGVVDFNSFNNFDADNNTSIQDINTYSNLLANGLESAIITNDTAVLDALLESDKDGDGVIAAAGTCNDANYQDDGYKGYDCFDTRAEVYEYATTDRDGDFIPNDVESYIGMNPDNWDENGNGIADGIDGAYDTYYPNQWHLRSTGLLTNNINNVTTIVGNDLDILDVQRAYMGYNDGNFTAIQVVDSGVEAAHEDLSANIDTALSLNAVNSSNNPTPTENVNAGDPESPLEIGHGTACAGIIASRGLNQKGTRGISPFSKISGSNWLENQTTDALSAIWLIDDSDSNAKITVSSNSWGIDQGNAYYNEIISYDTLLDAGAALREGKGRIYLFAAGNDRDGGRDANLDATASHRYSVTVAGLDYNNKYAPYSTPGANVWVSGYSGSWYVQTPTIATTLLTGDSYYARELSGYGAITFDSDAARAYTYAMNGTSAATPTVAGSLALVLEACPSLTQRDVKYLSAVTAKKVDVSSSGWITNQAGIKYSRDYGFGLVNPAEIIRRCAADGYANLGAEKNTVVEHNVPTSVAGGDTDEIEFSISEAMATEYIYLWHDIYMRDYTALEMSLTSPGGTTMPIIKNMVDDGHFDFTSGMRFGVAGFLDENTAGTWKLTISSTDPTVGFSFDEVDLQIFGH